MEKKKNFVENIHNSNYSAPYYLKPITHETMFCDAGRAKEKLSGEWNFCIDMYDSCLRSKWYLEKIKDEKGRYIPIDFAFDNWETIQVPSVWNTQKEKYFYYEGPAVYSKKFVYKSHGEERVFIKFGAANYEAKVFLNTEFLGVHKGGSTPFYIDVTDYLKEDNRIIVVVDNTRKKEQVPTNNTDWYNYGGLFRDVELIRLPKDYIKDFKIHLKKGTLDTIEAHIEISSQEQGEALIEIPEIDIAQTINIKDGKGTFEYQGEFTLWDVDNPKLYKVSVTYKQDKIIDKIGFREIRVDGSTILLNNKAVYLNGISTHEESVPNGRAVTDEEIIENIKLAKEMNCNYMRLAHYPHTQRVAEIADELGLMLWEEIPVYWDIEFENEETLEDARNQLTELIKRDQNRASVIIWSVGNENPDTDARLAFMSNLAMRAKELDNTRLVSAACLVDEEQLKIDDRLEAYLDIIGLNEYYGWYNVDFNNLTKLFNNSNPQKPVIITEFGGDGLSHHYGTIDDLGTETYQEYIYKRQVELFEKTPYIKGTSPWILFDFRCPRRHDINQREYNIKGLLSRDKKHKKLAYYIMQEFYKNRG